MGHPSPGLLPLRELGEAAAHRFGQGDPSFLQYGYEQGDGHLRAELAAFLSREYGFPVSGEELLISGGISQALDLICAVLTRPGDCVIVEDPSYFLSFKIFEDHGLKVVPVPVDADGLRPDLLEAAIHQHRPRLIYTIPAYQNPSGVTLSAGRRAELVRLARAHDCLILADEVYHLLGFGLSGGGERPPESFGRWAGGGGVLSLGSFSKILAPGARLGWIQAAPELLARLMEQGALASAGGFSPLGGGLVRSALELGLLETHLQRLRHTYRARAGALAAALGELRPLGVEFSAPQGGYFIWLKLPAGVQARALLPIALERGVRFQPGDLFSPPGYPATQADRARLCFAFYDEPDLREGVRRLGEALRDWGAGVRPA